MPTDASSGDPDPAYLHMAAAASHYQDIDHRDGLTRCLGALGALALARVRRHIAAWLIGATAAGRQDVGLTAWPPVAEAEIRVTGRLQTALPSAELAEQFTAGRAAKIDAALAHGFSALSLDRHLVLLPGSCARSLTALTGRGQRSTPLPQLSGCCGAAVEIRWKGL